MTLTIKEALDQGYEYCGRNNKLVTELNDLTEDDFKDTEWFLMDKTPKHHSIDHEGFIEQLAEIYSDEESEQSGRDDDTVYNDLKKLNLEESLNKINQVFENNPYYTLTEIKLIYNK